MVYCNDPIPDCDNPTIQELYLSNNQTINDCWFDRRKAISGRIYLAAAIFNGVCIIFTTCLFIYVATATSESDRIPIVKFSMKKIRRIWKRHSLQKRSVMGTVLGAIGHFLFSSGVLLGQALSGPVGCNFYFWGSMIGFYTWIYALIARAYRLWFLFRINEYKVKYVRMSPEERLLCVDEKDYKWYVKNRNNIGNRLIRPYIIYVCTIIVMLAVCIPVELVYVRVNSNCDFRHTAVLLIVYFGLYVLFVVPSLLWFLRHNADFHGIRREIWIDAIIGIPYFILYIVFFSVLTPSLLFVPKGGQFSLFAPANWIVFFTAAAHIVSVVLPVVMYLPIQNKHWVKARDCFNRHCTLIKKPPSSNPNTFYNDTMSPRSPPFLEIAKSDVSPDDMPNATSSSSESPEFIPELSAASLERCMTDPDMMHQLQDLAIRDFSSENLLFYETYLSLESKLKALLAKNSEVSEAARGSNKWMHSFLVKKRSVDTSTAAIFTKAESKNATQEDIEQQISLQKYWETPIPCQLYPDFVQLYEYFIRENTPSQVNISYRARHVIDKAFWKIYKQHPEINPRTERTCSTLSQGDIAFFPPPIDSIILHPENSVNSDKHLEIDEEDALQRSSRKISTSTSKCESMQITTNHDGDVPVLTMGLFEAARREVCWNIFNSVYPKLVEMYNKPY